MFRRKSFIKIFIRKNLLSLYTVYTFDSLNKRNALMITDIYDSRDPRFAGTAKSGKRSFTGTLFFENRSGDAIEDEREIDYSYLEVEDNKVDVWVDIHALKVSFDSDSERYPCGFSRYIDEDVASAIENDVKKFLGYSWSIREVNP